jgi:hypothetical protein
VNVLDVLFVGLVVLDGFLTQKLLALGAGELNPNPFVAWSAGHLWVRLIVAVVIVLLLRFFNKWKLLTPLYFAWLGICVYNAMMLLIVHTAILAEAISP